MPKKSKQRKGHDTKTNLPEEDTVTGQASPSSVWESATFMMEPYHELDPDGDLVLTLDSSSIGSKKVVQDAQGRIRPSRLAATTCLSSFLYSRSSTQLHG